MSAPDEPTSKAQRPPATEPPKLAETRRLLASVEELRALLAPLSDRDRQRVLELARSLRPGPGPAG